MTRDFRQWWSDGDDVAGGEDPRRPAAGKVSLTQRIPVQRRAKPGALSVQPPPAAEAFGFVQSYEREATASTDASFPDENPVTWLASEADQACRAAFDFDFATIQRAATSTSSIDSDVVHAAAARGLEAPASPLPFLDRIQASFGKHDVSHVQAHAGGAAAKATAAMDATAYATGDHVVFAGAPDLHTAAHEAAHIVQQRGGVQLKSGVGEAGDAYEQHADAVADKVAAGESAEALLDEMSGRLQTTQAARPKSVQRKRVVQPGGRSDDGKPEGGAPELSPQEDTGWHVFAASGKPFLIADRGGQHGFWVVRRWVEADSSVTEVVDPRNGAAALRAPSRAREILSAMGTANLDFAVQNLTFRFREHAQVEFFAVGAEAAHAIGLPPGRESQVERDVLDGLKVTVALDDPSILPGTAHTLTTGELQRTIEGARSFTGLAVEANGAAFLMQKWTGPGSLRTGNGVVTFPLNRGFCRTLFGMEAYDRWSGEQKTPRKRPPETSAPKLELENFYQRPIPGQLTHHADFIESGEAVRFEVVVDWPGHFPDPDEFDAPPMVTPSKFGNVALLQCAWRFERVPGFVGRMMRRAAAGADSPRPAGAASSHGTLASPSGGSEGSTPAGGGSALQGDAASQATDTAEVHHRFALQPGESSATFRVTCSARFDEYFEPATFTRDVVVMASPALMAKLQSEAFADMGTPDLDRTKGSWTGEAGPDFVGSPAAEKNASVVDPMAANREAQRERLEVLGDYLRNSDEMRDRPASAEAIAAIDAELARQRKTEELLAKDRARGWQSFQIRGTYLSRTEGLPSGPLDLHGTVRVEARYDRHPGDGAATVQRIRDDKYVVQLRDLSRRFEQNDFTFEGEGDTFDQALKAAFDDLAIAYPKGLVSIEAEQIRGEALHQTDGRAGPQAARGPSTGMVIGFQRSTDTTWKKVKETVWDPVAQTAINLGAIALMTLVPASAAVVAPALIAYNTVPSVDNISSQMDRGTLTLGTFAMSTGEIALNILPLVSRAKPLTAGWFMVETANWGGQVGLMAGTAVDMAKLLQAKQVSALAEEYQAFLELKKRALPSDPSLAAAADAIRQKAEAVNGEVYRQFDALVASNLVQMAAGSVIHNSSQQVRAAIVAHLTAVPRNPGTTVSSRTPATSDGASPPPVPMDDAPTAMRDAAPIGGTTRSGRRKDGASDANDRAEPTADAAHKREGGGDAAAPVDAAAASQAAVSTLAWDGSRFVAEPHTLSAHRDAWSASRPRDKVSKVAYDAETNTMYFEVRSGKSRFRVEADLPPRIVDAADFLSLENRIIGKPVKKESVGLEILRDLNRGNFEVLRKLGVDVPRGIKPPEGTEFGLGVTPDGRYVVVRGKDFQVDWSSFPDVIPIAHTHPSTPGNDLTHTGSDRVPLANLFEHTANPLLARELVFPSPADVSLVARRRVRAHRVITEFVLVNGQVAKAQIGDNTPRIEWVIREAREVGRTPFGEPVFESILVAEVGGMAVGTRKVWSVKPDGAGGERVDVSDPVLGNHFMEAPRFHPIEEPPGTGSQASRATTVPPPASNPGQTVSLPEQLVASHGEDATRWVLASLDSQGAEKLFAALGRETITSLMDVPAVQVQKLASAYSPTTIEKAAPEMGARRLLIELERLGPSVAENMIAQGAAKGKFQKYIRHADNMEAMKASMDNPAAIGGDSLIVDSQIMIAIRKLATGTAWAEMQPTEQVMINTLRGHAGLPPLVSDPADRSMSALVGSLDLRAANVAFGEFGPGVTAGGVELVLSRSDPRYTGLVNELGKPPAVGGNAGVADRAVVADAVFARRTGEEPPRLVTADWRVYATLAERYAGGRFKQRRTAGGTEKLAETIKREAPDGFLIELPDHLGARHPLRVVPIFGE